MIFQHTIDKVLSGAKTQTRRIVKPGDEPIYDWFKPHPFAGHVELSESIRAVFRNGMKLYEVGQTLAVQPGRGKKAVGRIEITGIRREDVRQISYEDAIAEGFGFPNQASPRWDFLQLWTNLHDKEFTFDFDPAIVDYRYKIGRKHGIVSWENLQGIIRSRPAERYQAWVLEFRLVETS